MAYCYVRKKLPNGKTRDEHRLVVEKILGRKLKTTESVHHINGKKKDNRPPNLEIIDRAEHSKMHMRKLWELNQNSLQKRQYCIELRKLADDQVREVRKIYESSNYKSFRQLAIKYGISRPALLDIVTYKTYKDVV